MYGLVGKAKMSLKYKLIELKNKLKKQKQILKKKNQQQLRKNKNQQGTTINEAPCAGSTMSSCSIFNLFGYDTSNGSTNGNGGSTNGNGGSTDGNGGSTYENGSQQVNKILNVDEESPDTNLTQPPLLTPVSSQNASFYFEYKFSLTPTDFISVALLDEPSRSG